MSHWQTDLLTNKQNFVYVSYKCWEYKIDETNDNKKLKNDSAQTHEIIILCSSQIKLSISLLANRILLPFRCKESTAECFSKVWTPI